MTIEKKDSEQLQEISEVLKEIEKQVGHQAHKNPVPQKVYDFVVIGGGTAGLIAALGANALGAKVALIESRFLGGDCLNDGCVPSKGLISIADKLHQSKQFFAGFGKSIELDTSDWVKYTQMARAKIAPHDAVSRFVNMGLDIFFGKASFIDPHTLQLDQETKIAFKKSCICTGASARKIAIEGALDEDILTNESVFHLPHLPKKLLVVGSGPIGCELAQSFIRLGSEVTMATMSKSLFEFQDPFIQDRMHEVFKEEGLKTHFESTVIRAYEKDGEKVAVLKSSGAEVEVPFEKILLSVGRVPNTAGLSLEKAGVEFDSRGIKVDQYLRTNQKHIFASGDVLGKDMFTHAADAQSRVVVQNAWTPIKKKSKHTIPKVTYTSPEVASVMDVNFEDQKNNLEKISMQFSEIDRSIIKKEQEGVVCIYIDSKKRIKGVEIMHSIAGEMLPQIQIAMAKNMKITDFSAMIYAYPTLSEIFRRMGDAERAKGFTPFLQSLSKKIVRWMA